MPYTHIENTPLLDQILSPNDLKVFTLEQLEELSKELRSEIIKIVSRTGGHLGASLGVVELTIALHYIFDAPIDKLIWDVGHQSYAHKLLTGRREMMRLVRQEGGASGFPVRAESRYDTFGTAHAGTSISAALGFSVARDLKKENYHVVSVIGDGALTCGMAYEAMNNAGSMASRLLVILNDNDMSIASPVGAMNNYLSKLLSSNPYHSFRQVAKNVAHHFPKSIETAAKRIEEYTKGMLSGGTLFEELGFFYIGPIDGHRLNQLIPVLKNIKNRSETSPIFLHVVTQKGKGYPPAEASIDKFHGVNQFDVRTGIQSKQKALAKTFTKVFSDALIKEAENDEKIVAITAAMPCGTGLDSFNKKFPCRFFDVGISEQHAVTFAAGLACEGLKPFVAIYSTFLQRAYDQIVHDVVLQNLPVRFAIDRAGLVGADGPTHVGAYDLVYLSCLPNIIIMAPADESELIHMVKTASSIDDAPCAFRYPRGEGFGVSIPEEGLILPIGKGRILKEGTRVALLSLGGRLYESLKAAEILDNEGISTTVADVRFAKPFDQTLIKKLACHHEILVIIEEGSIGGFGYHALSYLSNEGLLTATQAITMTLPDLHIPHSSQAKQYEKAGLRALDIVRSVFNKLGKSDKNYIRYS